MSNVKDRIGLLAVAAVMFVAGPALAGSLNQVDFEVTLFGDGGHEEEHEEHEEHEDCSVCEATSAAGDDFWGWEDTGGPYFGNFVYDDSFVNHAGNSQLSPGDGLVSVYFDFMGYIIEETDDIDFPDYPKIHFSDGAFTDSLDFMFLAGISESDIYTIDGTNFSGPGSIGKGDWFEKSTAIAGSNGQGSGSSVIGVVTYSQPKHLPHSPPTGIPSPAAVSGGLALLFAMGLRRRRNA